LIFSSRGNSALISKNPKNPKKNPWTRKQDLKEIPVNPEAT
jgi:hypothetical protein